MANGRAVLELTAQSIIRQVDQSAHIMLSRSSESLEHLKNARMFFERGMVREAAAKATAADIAELAGDSCRTARYLGQGRAFMTADMRFHTQIAAISGNPIFVAVSEAMLGWLKAYHTEMLIWTGKEKFTLAEHEEIINLIAAAIETGAEQALDQASRTVPRPLRADRHEGPNSSSPCNDRLSSCSALIDAFDNARSLGCRHPMSPSPVPRKQSIQCCWMAKTLSWILCQGRDAQARRGGDTSHLAVSFLIGDGKRIVLARGGSCPRYHQFQSAFAGKGLFKYRRIAAIDDRRDATA